VSLWLKEQAVDYAVKRNAVKNNPVYPVILSNFIELKIVKIRGSAIQLAEPLIIIAKKPGGFSA